MEDKQHITIHIADASPFDHYIKRDKEELMRSAASQVNKIWAKWSNEFKDKSSKDVLAMLAFRYAHVYYELLEQVNANEAALESAEKALDSILLDVK